MKSIIPISISILLATSVALVSCEKTEKIVSHEGNTVHFCVKAGTPDTKTYIEGQANGVYQPCWNSGDKLGVFFTIRSVSKSTDLTSADATFTAAPSADNYTATFSGDYTLSDNATNVTFYSFYPSSAIAKAYAGGIIGLDINSEQTPCVVNNNYSFDQSNDLLIAKPHTCAISGNTATSDENMQFARISSVLKINLKCESAAQGQTVQSLTVSTASANISGRIKVDLANSSVGDVISKSNSTKIVATPTSVACPSIGGTNNSIFLSTAPVTIAENEVITFSVQSGEHYVVKTVSTHKAIDLAPGKITVINLTITDNDWNNGQITNLTTIDAIYNKAVEVASTATNVKVTFNDWIVSAVKDKNAYITDGTNGFILYDTNHGLAEGDQLSGTVICKVQLYNGSAEVTGVTSEDLTVVKNQTITPATIAVSELSGKNTGALLTYAGLNYDGTSFYQGTNAIKPYKLSASLPSLVAGNKYKVTGVFIMYNTTKEICPRSTSDFEDLNAAKYDVSIYSSIANGTASASLDSATEGTPITLTATPNDGYAFDSWTVTNETTSESIEVTNNVFTMPSSNVTVSASFKEATQKTISISYTDIPSGYTATTGTSGSFVKGDLTVNYAGINTKSSETAATSYSYAFFLKNNGYIYSNTAFSGYYVSSVVVTFGANTGVSGKVGISLGSAAITSRDSNVSGSVSKGGTCQITNPDTSKTYWNFSTTAASVQVSSIEIVYTKVQ